MHKVINIFNSHIFILKSIVRIPTRVEYRKHIITLTVIYTFKAYVKQSTLRAWLFIKQYVTQILRHKMVDYRPKEVF